MNEIRLYTSNHLETLAKELASVLRTPLASPFQEEVIVVQSNGMQRWVSMQLAEQHGICANYRFPFPNAFIHEIFCKVVPDIPERSHFDPAIMTWKIMKLLEIYRLRPGFESLAGYLGETSAGLKRLQLAERIADLFDQYLVFRPEMILRWQKGEEDHWQAILWRALAATHENEHRAALGRLFLDRFKTCPPGPDGLPERISIFGISALPRFHLQMIAAISQVVQVHLFLMNPCSQYWGDIISDREMGRVLSDRDISPDEWYLQKGNSLLASMGALGRDFWDAIDEFDCRQFEFFQNPAEQNMLCCIQSDILNLQERDSETEAAQIISASDKSLQIHSCHSPMREMEVLHDRLLDMFEQDPSLTPKDILVMAPDIEAYAPYIEAVFDAPADESRRIPYSIADQSLRKESQLVGTFLTILDLWGGRFRVSEILAVLESRYVQRKFGLSEDDLETITKWMEGAQIRWGIDGGHRRQLGLPPFSENTWRAGLDRLLLGYAMPARDLQTYGGIVPCDSVEGSEALVLGRWVEFQERLFEQVTTLGLPRKLADWSVALTELVESLFDPDESAFKEMQTLRLKLRELSELEEAAEFDGPIDITAMKNYLRRQLERESFGYGFIAGGVTFCAMLPMRSIPHKVICLVGMNNDAYPRQTKVLGFDLMAKHPRKGDRSRRNDDRYLFLEAILSAREKLYISYLGQSVQDNSSIPPSVLVSELIDYIEKGFTCRQGSILGQIVTKHRLQAFSPQYFQDPDGRLFSYSEENCAAAKKLLQVREVPAPFISAGLSQPEEQWQMLDVTDLCSFFSNPARFLLNRRLGIYLRRDAPALEESESFAFDGLQKYLMERDLVELSLGNLDPATAYPSLMAAGMLPHGTPGKCAFECLAKGAESFARKTKDFLRDPVPKPESIDLQIAGFRLVGEVSGIFSGQLVHYRYTRLKPSDHLRLWIHHLAVSLTIPGTGRRSLLIGLSPSGKNPDWIVYEYSQPDDPAQILHELLKIYWDGLIKPVHFFPKSSWLYAVETLQKAKSADEALIKATNLWMGNDFAAGESQDPYYQLCFQYLNPVDEAFQSATDKTLRPLFYNQTEFKA